MVKLYISLLALTLATSSAMATFKRTGNVPLDLEHFFNQLPEVSPGHHDGFLNPREVDDLEERGMFGLIGGIGKLGKLAKGGIKAGKLIKKAKKADDVAKQFQQPNVPNKSVRVMDAVKNIAKLVSNNAIHPHRRGLEDEEELLQRDFEDSDEEFFGRELRYDDDFLAERDVFDDDLD